MNRPVVLREAQAFADDGHFVEALALCELVLRDGIDSAALRIKGAALAGMRHDQEAVAALKRACELDPADAAAFVALGESLRTLGKFEEALTALDAAVRIAPSMMTARLGRGSLRLKGGDEKGALIDFEAASRLMPESERKREVEEMIRELSAAPGYRASPFAEAIDYARTAYQLGSFQHCLEFIAQLGPSTAGVVQLLFLRTLCLAALGRKEEALKVSGDPLLAAAMTSEMRKELDQALGGS